MKCSPQGSCQVSTKILLIYTRSLPPWYTGNNCNILNSLWGGEQNNIYHGDPKVLWKYSPQGSCQVSIKILLIYWRYLQYFKKSLRRRATNTNDWGRAYIFYLVKTITLEKVQNSSWLHFFLIVLILFRKVTCQLF